MTISDFIIANFKIAGIELSDLNYTPTPPNYAGDPIVITVLAKNEGTNTDSYTVVCEVEDA